MQYINLIPVIKEIFPNEIFKLRKPFEVLFKLPIQGTIVFVASRSVGKSYTLGAITLALAKLQRNIKIGYFMPTQSQIQRNVDETFNYLINNSPALYSMYRNTADKRGVYQKRFKNNSVIFFRWQIKQTDSEFAIKIRGTHPDIIIFDEAQDLYYDFIDKIKPTIINSKFGIDFYAGTFKTEFHPTYDLYINGTQMEWAVKCPKCNTENFATKENIDYNNLKIGPFCRKCQYPLTREIIKNNGYLVSLNPNGEYLSLRLSSLFAYWIPWSNIMKLKISNYENFVNEIVGEPTSLQDKIITENDIKRICDNNIKMDISYILKNDYLLFAGIDWQGDWTYTVLSIIGYKNGKLYLLYVKKYTGEDARKDKIHFYVEKDIALFRPIRIFGDWGMGLGRNSYLKSKNYPIFEMEFTGGDYYPKYDVKREIFLASKFRMLEMFYDMIKNKKIIFPNYDDIKPFIREYTSYIRIEVAKFKKEPYLSYEKEDPQALDDALMSLLLAIASFYTFKKANIFENTSKNNLIINHDEYNQLIKNELNHINYIINDKI